MKIKQYLTKTNIIIFSIVISIFLITILVLYLYNNTTIFKNTEEVQSDLLELQQGIQDNQSNELDTRGSVDVDDKIYSDYVGVSNGTLYIKEDAEDKVKEAAKDTEIGYETSKVSSNGILEIEPYSGTNAISCKIVSNTEDIVTIIAYNAGCLCENTYVMGSIKNHSDIEKGKDNLIANIIKGNTTYTIRNNFSSGTNTTFFFDKDMKYISKTTQNTFTTPENAKWFKVISDFKKDNKQLEGIELQYCLVLGKEPGNSFGTNKTETAVDVSNQNEVYFPLNSDKLVIYCDGGEIEVTYVKK